MKYFIAVSIILFNIWDCISTHIALASGNFIELNPIVNYFWESIGTSWSLTIKILLTFLNAFSAIYFWNKSKLIKWGSIVVFFVYLIVSLNNLINLLM